MVMNILIDIGNTSCKIAFCPNCTCLKADVKADCLAGADCLRVLTQKEVIGAVKQRLDGSKADKIILSSVRKRSVRFEKQLEKLSKRFFLLNTLLVNNLLAEKQPDSSDALNVLRNMPDGMGADRIAAIYGAEVLFPYCDKIVFDFGTATTVEFIDSSRTQSPSFIGGSISLGLQTRYKALSHFTAKIPYINPDEYLERNDICTISTVGFNLESALAAGNILGIMFEIEGYMAAHPNRKVILTGGNAVSFGKRLDGKAVVEPNLVLIGLASIIDLL